MTKLSIILPTFNRVNHLDAWLKNHLQYINSHDVEICILNNASTDETKLLLEKFTLQLNIINQKKTVFVGRNIIDGIFRSEGQYIWIVGDTYHISPELFEEVYQKIDKHNVVTSLQWMPKHTALRGKIYTPDERAEIQGMSSCITASIHRRSDLTKDIYEKISKSYFPHTVLLYVSTIGTGRSIYLT